MIGFILVLIVGAIVLMLFGGWLFGIPVAAVALVLLVLFLVGWGRRAATGRP
jgi:hypothetical protein